MSAKVYVGDLGPNGNKQELEKEFERFGALKSVWVARNPPGFAFVEFEDPHDAEDAIRELDGKTVGNVRIRVEFAKNRGSGGGGGGGGGGRGYQGGNRRPPPNRGYYDRRGSPPPRRRSRSPYRRDSRSRSPWRRKSNYDRSPYYNRRSHSKSPYYDRRRSRSPPYRRSPGPRDDRRMDSRSPSPR